MNDPEYTSFASAHGTVFSHAPGTSALLKRIDESSMENLSELQGHDKRHRNCHNLLTRMGGTYPGTDAARRNLVDDY